MTEEETLKKSYEWHNATPGDPAFEVSLHEWLGMTWEQYKEWHAEQIRKTLTKK